MEPIGSGRYRHFKGAEYEVLGIATHSETGEELVVYRALYGEGKLWVRPVELFVGVVEKNGIPMPRFEQISPHPPRKRKSGGPQQPKVKSR